jgi:hypothetical protein
MNPVPTFPSHFSMIHSNSILPSTPSLYISLSLSSAPQPSLGLGLLRNLLPLKMAEFLGGFLIIFLLQRRVASPAPNPHPGGPGLWFISLRGRVAQLYPQVSSTHFSRLLRYLWVTVGLFLFPGHHTEIPLDMPTKILYAFISHACCTFCPYYY